MSTPKLPPVEDVRRAIEWLLANPEMFGLVLTCARLDIAIPTLRALQEPVP